MREEDRLDVGLRDGPALYERALEQAAEAERQLTEVLAAVIRAEDQIWENSPQGLLRHMTNEAMNGSDFCLDVYQQVIEAGGHSGKHRHFSEEVLFVLEGTGYDLHWDPILRAEQKYEWEWQPEPKRFDWKPGDFIYVPPYVTHQHVAGGDGRARLVSATSRIVRAMGFDGLEQVEPASCASADAASLL